jgi:hypothetical protein
MKDIMLIHEFHEMIGGNRYQIITCNTVDGWMQSKTRGGIDHPDPMTAVVVIDSLPPMVIDGRASGNSFRSWALSGHNMQFYCLHPVDPYCLTSIASYPVLYHTPLRRDGMLNMFNGLQFMKSVAGGTPIRIVCLPTIRDVLSMNHAT